jgi:ubiquinone/menaquinone biosynthesis C-methylase UbiE
MNENEQYFNSRLKFDKKRKVLWSTLCKYYFSKYISKENTVLELGAGWCDFINNIDCKEKIAVDLWPGISLSAEDNVEVYINSVTSMPFLKSNSVDVAFASNLVEHLNRFDFKLMLEECERILRPNGLLILLQPNFKYSYKSYFDDYTHVSIWTDVSITTFLKSIGWEVVLNKPKFLPLTVKSKFPVSKFLIRYYLIFPIKFFSGQMLVIFKKDSAVN